MINDTDLLVVSHNGIDYKITALDLKEFLIPGAPWKGAAGIYHVIVTNKNDIKITNQDKIYNLDTETEVSSIDAAGEWIVTGPNTQFMESKGNWVFGDLTDTRKVTNMRSMFFNATKFNSDISNWDVGNVTNMCNMFRKAEVFNSDISNWNTSNVTDMSSVFQGTPQFNSDISGWDVSNVRGMSNMLRNSHKFNQDVSNWNTSNVTNMNYLFKELPTFNQDLSKWEVGNVTNMVNMFWNARTFNQDLTSWCVSKIKSQPVNFKTNSGMPKDGHYDPKWGTCP